MAEQIDATKAAGLFKSYDIRGIAPEELSPEFAYRIGRALVLELGVDVVAVGRDMRVTGPLLSSSLIDGIRDQGADVTDLGLVSTDALYFAVGKYGFPAGVMITASHNPPEYNGFKICREDARAVSFEDGIKQIRDRALGDDFPPLAANRGDLIEKDVIQAYAEHVLSMVDVSAIKPLKIAIDAGNGMAGKTVPVVVQVAPGRGHPALFRARRHLSESSREPDRARERAGPAESGPRQ